MYLFFSFFLLDTSTVFFSPQVDTALLNQFIFEKNQSEDDKKNSHLKEKKRSSFEFSNPKKNSKFIPVQETSKIMKKMKNFSTNEIEKKPKNLKSLTSFGSFININRAINQDYGYLDSFFEEEQKKFSNFFEEKNTPKEKNIRFVEDADIKKVKSFIVRYYF